MKRRNLLTAAGVAALAGCASSGDENEDPEAENESQDEDQEDTSQNEEQEQQTDDEQEGEPEFVVTDITPDSAEIGEDIRQEFIIENQGDSPGSSQVDIYYTSTNGETPEPTDWEETSIQGRLDVGEQSVYTPFSTFSSDIPAVVFTGVEIREVDHRLYIPGSKEPIITDFSVTGAEVGDTVDTTFEYWYWAEDGEIDTSWEVTVNSNAGNSIVNDGERIEDTGVSGWQSLTDSVEFDSSDWEEGEFDITLALRDEQRSLRVNESTTLKLDQPDPQPAFTQCQEQQSNTYVSTDHVSFSEIEKKWVQQNSEEITYNTLLREIDQRCGEAVVFNGTVAQTLGEPGAFIFLINVGDFSQNIFVSSVRDQRLIEDDPVEVLGQILGPETYETAGGSATTIPAVAASEIELIE